MREGQVVEAGAPADVITPEIVQEVFGLRASVIDDPVSHTPTIIPIGRHHCADGE
jgi:iron complex transport system ATP-binding protein